MLQDCSHLSVNTRQYIHSDIKFCCLLLAVWALLLVFYTNYLPADFSVSNEPITNEDNAESECAALLN